ncbi:hypothetical protein BN1723_004028 [Verticillium longisporum]|uniref:Uncharacterized protein n=1 Tax=Verticillium longisporum TaxID=100787 RepID=A0A0G4MJE1_VERLO|nr:hypothetical protein BN1708_005253 [Verticillium longisporum]CRK34356.1 hypothetical protein BN1723_004028 [Verticillium longisporum]
MVITWANAIFDSFAGRLCHRPCTCETLDCFRLTEQSPSTIPGLLPFSLKRCVSSCPPSLALGTVAMSHSPNQPRSAPRQRLIGRRPVQRR